MDTYGFGTADYSFKPTYDRYGLYNSDNLNDKSWLEQNAKGLAGIGMGIQGLSGLANAYMGYKNYQLAQEQFKFQKGLARIPYATEVCSFYCSVDKGVHPVCNYC